MPLNNAGANPQPRPMPRPKPESDRVDVREPRYAMAALETIYRQTHANILKIPDEKLWFFAFPVFVNISQDIFSVFFLDK